MDLEEYARKLGDLGIELIFFDKVVYCENTDEVTIADTANGFHNRFKDISGTLLREYFMKGENPPDYLIRTEVAESIRDLEFSGKGKIFEE